MPLYKTILHYHSLHTFEFIWIVSLCRHLFAGWAVSKECMVLVCTLHRRRGFPGPFIERWKWCRIAVINRCHPWSFLARFFFPANEFVKILTDELEEWHHGWTGLFFSRRLAKRINTRDSAPILRSFPPGWVFGRKKASSQQLWVHSQPVIHFPWNQHSTLK